MSFSKVDGKSPVRQDFIWLGEYYDGTHLAEFDLQTKKENSFYDIQQNKLIRFGLIGHGMKLYFESDGLFKLNGKSVAFVYRANGVEYPLTGHHRNYSDIITYKDAEATFNPRGGMGGAALQSKINQYNVGYKSEIEWKGVKFHFKPLCKVPFGDPVYMNVWLVSDTDLDGEIVIKVNGRDSQTIHAPLRAGVGGEVNWVVK